MFRLSFISRNISIGECIPKKSGIVRPSVNLPVGRWKKVSP